MKVKDSKILFLHSLSFFIIFFSIFYSLPWKIYPQEPEETSYPTLISVRYENGKVTINFEPLEDEDIKYRIYRSLKPLRTETDITEDLLISEITKNDIPYSDSPKDDGLYYYAVTSLKESREYKSLVLLQNTILRPLDFSPFPDAIQSIEIKPEDNQSIDIYFKPVNPNYSYHLYKNSAPIMDVQGIEPEGTLVGKEDHFPLKIEKNTQYFFLITSVNRLGVENKGISPGKNQNSEPYILKEMEKKVQIPITKPKRELTNEELILSNLKSFFFRGNYKKAIDNFLVILKRRQLSQGEKAKVYFYMGQTYFYLGDYKKAVKYFILSKELPEYQDKAEIWIDRTLDKIE